MAFGGLKERNGSVSARPRGEAVSMPQAACTLCAKVPERYSAEALGCHCAAAPKRSSAIRKRLLLRPNNIPNGFGDYLQSLHKYLAVRVAPGLPLCLNLQA